MNVLILSETFDVTTDIVCSWLNYFKQDYLRVNNPNLSIKSVFIDVSNTEIIFSIQGTSSLYKLSDFKGI